MPKPTVICLTPVKNEAWILDRFLKCASLWADHIIIADQNSEDESREIARRYPKVTLIENPNTEFNEPERQKMLIAAARKIPGPRLLVALDADEMLTANFMEHPEWNTVLNSPPGTIIEFQWVNILPGFDSYWSPVNANFFYPLGFIDDGSEHIGNKIHSPRIPEPAQSPRIRLTSIRILHYAYTNWDRVSRKHRWYQCWEILNRPSEHPVKIYRFYYSMNAFPKDDIYVFNSEWIDGYEKQGIDMTSVYRASLYWWDREILKWMSKYGVSKFRKLAIWDVDWTALSQQVDYPAPIDGYRDPRNWIDKLIHYWLKSTQSYRRSFWVRAADKCLKFISW